MYKVFVNYLFSFKLPTCELFKPQKEYVGYI